MVESINRTDDINPFTDDERGTLTSDWNDDRHRYGWIGHNASVIYEQAWGRGRDYERRRWLGPQPAAAQPAAAQPTEQIELISTPAPHEGWVSYRNEDGRVILDLGRQYAAKIIGALADASVTLEDSGAPDAAAEVYDLREIIEQAADPVEDLSWPRQFVVLPAQAIPEIERLRRMEPGNLAPTAETLRRLAELEGENQALKLSLDVARELDEKHVSDIRVLEQDVNAKQAEIDELEMRVREQSEGISGLGRELAEARSDTQRAIDAITELQERNVCQADVINGQSARIEKQRSAIQAANDLDSDRRLEIQTLRDRVEALTRDQDAEVKTEEAQPITFAAAGGWFAPTDQVYEMTSPKKPVPTSRKDQLLNEIEYLNEEIEAKRVEQGELAREMMLILIDERRNEHG